MKIKKEWIFGRTYKYEVEGVEDFGLYVEQINNNTHGHPRFKVHQKPHTFSKGWAKRCKLGKSFENDSFGYIVVVSWDEVISETKFLYDFWKKEGGK